MPVLLRMTTRVCHSKTIVRPGAVSGAAPAPAHFVRDVPSARDDSRLRAAGAPPPAQEAGGDRAVERTSDGPNQSSTGRRALGIITSGISFMHVREAAPEASVLKLGMTYPLPLENDAQASPQRRPLHLVDRRGRPVPGRAARAAGIAVEGKPEMYRFGELNVAACAASWRRHLARAAPPPGKPPELCPGCPHRTCSRRCEPGLHRGRRHRLLLARRAAAVFRDGHAGLHGRGIGVGLGCGTCCRPSRRGAWSA
jgi:indolepyruvate ferredoxin oxidoreductase alpha subunit